MEHKIDIYEIPAEYQEFDKEVGIHLHKTPLVLVRGFHGEAEAKKWIEKYNKEAYKNFQYLKIAKV